MNKFLCKIIFLISVLISCTAFAAEEGDMPIIPQGGKLIESMQIGEIKVTVLSEGIQTGSTDILLNAPTEDITKLFPGNVYTLTVNTFLLSTPEGYVLVDTGFGRQLFNNLEELNISPDEIKAILLTHMHVDHTGGLVRDNQITFPNADIYVNEKELAYWKDQKESKVLALYKNRIKTFNPNQWNQQNNPLLKNICPIAAYGHTPGHTMYQIESQNEKFLIWGDLTHVMPIQIPMPDIAVIYDVDPVQAVKTRKEIFAHLANNPAIWVGGTHIPFPGMGILTPGKSPESYIFIYSN